jgi:serine/threonine protein kinase
MHASEVALEIGRGREATVYAVLARGGKNRSAEYYALRVPRGKKLTARSAVKICALPAHAHVVRILDVDMATGRISLEYVGGGTLAEELTCCVVSPQRATCVVRQVLRGLGHLHAHGLVHGDVSPENVLLAGPARQCKLTDYFAQKPLLGAPAYMAPEAAREEGGYAGDVWSVGCLMLAVTGLPPWQQAEVRLEDGSLVDLDSPAALLYHLAFRDIALEGPPEFSACADPGGRLFFGVLRSIFKPARERATVAELLKFRFQ